MIGLKIFLCDGTTGEEWVLDSELHCSLLKPLERFTIVTVRSFGYIVVTDRGIGRSTLAQASFHLSIGLELLSYECCSPP